MLLFPRVEKISLNLSLSHFSLMFGYKLFSLYFPLFLLAKKFSFHQVGYTYLFIYLPIALFAPLVGYLNHKINPALLSSLGIIGYSLYCLGMIFTREIYLFYFWQIFLGISAALFFVSSRAILMGSHLENPEESFSLFYSAPIYASAFSPAVGAILIYNFGFKWAFGLSFIIQLLTAFYLFLKIHKETISLTEKNLKIEESISNYKGMIKEIKNRDTLPYLAISFTILFVAGFYFAFFVIFLKNGLFWSQNKILLFESIASFIFLPLSLFLIKKIGERKREENIFQGALASGFFSLLLGIPLILNFWTLILIFLGRTSGNIMVGASRSGMLTTKLIRIPEESAALDSVFSPLGISLGALASGILVKFTGFSLLFVLGGIIIITETLLLRIKRKI